MLLSYPSYLLASHSGSLPNKTTYWSPRLSTEFHGSSERKIDRVNLSIPFYQQVDRLLFGDSRYMRDNIVNHEFNLGLVWRQIIDDSYILGGYGYFDRKKWKAIIN